MRRYDVLDSLRGICACMIVLLHFNPNSHLLGLSFIQNSYLFVDFFFVLSGFIILHTYRARLSEGYGLGRYLILRFGRVYPLHFFMLLAFVVYEIAWALILHKFSSDPRAAFSGNSNLGSLVWNIFLLNSFGLDEHFGWNYPSWSIGAEFYTYMLFGVVLIVSGKRLIVVLAALGAVGLLSSVIVGGNTIDTPALGFPRCVSGFAIGALFCCIRQDEQIFARFGKGTATVIEFVIAALCVNFVIFAGTNALSFIAPFVFIVAIAVFAEERGKLSQILATSPMMWVGTRSYSIYMVHVFVIMLTGNVVTIVEKLLGVPLKTKIILAGRAHDAIGTTLLQGDIAYVVQLSLVLLAASATFRWVEVPFRKLSRDIAARRLGSPKSCDHLAARASLRRRVAEETEV